MSAKRIGQNDPCQAPVTYTNRKGRTCYLCQGVTKTGRPRYYFTQKPKSKVLERIPEGYRISESVNLNISKRGTYLPLVFSDHGSY